MTETESEAALLDYCVERGNRDLAQLRNRIGRYYFALAVRRRGKRIQRAQLLTS